MNGVRQPRIRSIIPRDVRGVANSGYRGYCPDGFPVQELLDVFMVRLRSKLRRPLAAVKTLRHPL